jgi:hypothetical protein
MTSARVATLAVVTVALAAGLPAVEVTATDTPLRDGAPNHPPSAQAGPPPVVVDGGPHDADDETDGDADIYLAGGRSSDVDDYWNETHCRFPVSWTGGWPLEYDWYEKGQRDGPIAGGYAPILSSRSFGFQAFTLEVSDHCDATDTDSVQAFVATSKTELARWTFANGHSSAWSTQGAGHVTEACEVDADGAYLAFNRGTNATGACTYRSDQPVQGTATLTADTSNADVVALEFDTRFDTREGVGTWDEELFGNVREDVIEVQASFDGGQTWTQPNHTFSYDRMDEDLDDRWHRAGGIYNLSDRDVTAEEILFRFTFDSVTAPEDAAGYGWLVDDVRLTSLTT